jgi:hypothetical protein
MSSMVMSIGGATLHILSDMHVIRCMLSDMVHEPGSGM